MAVVGRTLESSAHAGCGHSRRRPTASPSLPGIGFWPSRRLVGITRRPAVFPQGASSAVLALDLIVSLPASLRSMGLPQGATRSNGLVALFAFERFLVGLFPLIVSTRPCPRSSRDRRFEPLDAWLF